VRVAFYAFAVAFGLLFLYLISDRLISFVSRLSDFVGRMRETPEQRQRRLTRTKIGVGMPLNERGPTRARKKAAPKPKPAKPKSN
jgi:hypothetical protein